MSFEIVRTVAALRERVARWHARGERVGLVPTMGALHQGHFSLVEAARKQADRVIVTLFVNPRQFNNPADLAAYPRTEDSDARQLAPLGVNLLFAPGVEEMYPDGFATNVSVAGVSEGLCGAFRPGHFDGVATVVAKLFIQSGADVAFFGEKDFQQLAVIRRMARDLDIPIEVVGCPTVREADGLAMSSRNMRLTPEGRKVASKLSEALFAASEKIANGGDGAVALEAARWDILNAGYAEVEYLELRDAESLKPVTNPERPARLLVAAWLDGVRLIDNVPVEVSSLQ